MDIGELVGTGRTADVFALDEGRVLRRYRYGISAAGETAVMAHRVGHGFPGPAVWPGTDPGERVMLRLHGPTRREALFTGEVTAEEGPPGRDTAMAALILAQAALTMPGVGPAVRPLLASLLRHLGGAEGMLPDEARRRRAANPPMSPEETGRLGEAVALITGTALV